jgi:hypothetical protein
MDMLILHLLKKDTVERKLVAVPETLGRSGTVHGLKRLVCGIWARLSMSPP